MSLSLSSLLNPSPTEARDQDQQSSSPSSSNQQQAQIEGRDNLAPLPYVQSPEVQNTQLPKYTPPPRQRPFTSASGSSSGSVDATITLTKVATSVAPAPTQWNGHGSGAGIAQGEQLARERRASGGAASFDLPPPPLAGPRKMSSPTLEQYQVASRSPEQRRASMALPQHPGFTLPPLQNITSPVEGKAMFIGSEREERREDKPRVDQSVDLPQPVADSLPSARESDHVRPVDQTLKSETLNAEAPINIKEETAPSPQALTSPLDPRHLSAPNIETDAQTSKAITSIKQGHASRTQSPLRESSVPMPTTEAAAPADSAATKKRTAPPKTKKGTATAAKKVRPAKKRKLEPSTGTPSSQRTSSKPSNLKVNGSSKATPLASSPTPSETRSSAAADDVYDDDESMADSNEDVEGSGDVYCICRKPDNGTFMIGCDGQCDDWFHGKCVGVEERDKNLIDRYLCPNCGDAGLGRTTWKRMCRRQGCRQPARVGKNAPKGGKGTSKYCSDECGVLFFREMSANSRGRDQAKKDRSTRRRTGGGELSTVPAGDHEARGGVLSPGEIRALLDQSSTAEEFRSLGDGVLSPPATPETSKSDGGGDGLTDAERKSLDEIAKLKERARERHQLLKDRLKFVTLVKTAASHAATEKDLKPKDYCGFDSRIEWSEDDFAAWRRSPGGQQSFELDRLDVTPSDLPMGDGVEAATSGDSEIEICERKKCARHVEWSKLAVDDVRFEMADNSDRMRGLELEEREIKERAAMRVKVCKYGGDGGRVEVHGLGTNGVTNEVSPAEGGEAAEVGDAMEVDAAT